MKTLRLILLLSLIGIYAQSQDLQYSQYCDEFHQISEGLYLCKNGKEINILGVRLMAIDLFLEYKQECYNDSSKVHELGNSDFVSSCYRQNIYSTSKYHLKLICANPHHFKWEHKHPTFEDFLNWIDKKYK